MKRAIAYTRCRNDNQFIYDNQIMVQLKKIEAYCEANEIRIVKEVKENASAKNFERKEFQKMLEYLKLNEGNIDTLVITKWDRFSRNLGGTYKMIKVLKELGVEIYCVEQPIDKTNNRQMVADIP